MKRMTRDYSPTAWIALIASALSTIPGHKSFNHPFIHWSVLCSVAAIFLALHTLPLRSSKMLLAGAIPWLVVVGSDNIHGPFQQMAFYIRHIPGNTYLWIIVILLLISTGLSLKCSLCSGNSKMTYCFVAVGFVFAFTLLAKDAYGYSWTVISVCEAWLLCTTFIHDSQISIDQAGQALPDRSEGT